VLVRADQPWSDAQLAQLYDVFEFDADLPFYLDLARQEGPRVLEVACGSGRLLMPLVRAGLCVVGIDISPHMLALARVKLEAAPVAGQAELVQTDMRTFELDQRDFDLAIVPVKSFAYLTETDEQLQCLESIRAHLRPAGLLALDLLHPLPEWTSAARGSMRDDLLQHVADQGFTLSRVESVVSTDLARQVRVIRSIYEMVDDSGKVLDKRFVEWRYRERVRAAIAVSAQSSPVLLSVGPAAVSSYALTPTARRPAAIRPCRCRHIWPGRCRHRATLVRAATRPTRNGIDILPPQLNAEAVPPALPRSEVLACRRLRSAT
jgi:SAM-dependent methyltransferase